MAETQSTGANIAGLRIRQALSDAFDKYGISKTAKNYKEGLINPILNLYPNAVNLSAAALESGAGLLGAQYNAGRMPLYETGPLISPLITGDSQNQDTQIDPEPPEPKPTPSNTEVSQEEAPTISVRKPNESGFLYRVMYAGKGGKESQVFETQKEADNALKNSGGKGAVARIALGYKPSEKKEKVFNDKYMIGKLGEPLPAEEQAAKKKAYLDTFYKVKADKTMGDIRDAQLKQNLKKIKSPEYKAAVQERIKLANEAKRAEDKKAGAGFESWRSNVKAGRVAEEDFNTYNQQLGILKQAYTQAKRSGNLKAAYDISMDIEDFQAGIPKEMGARKKEITRRTLATRNAMLEEQEKNARTQAANPDYINSFNKPIAMRYQ
jgi:hypothetical protein